MIYACGRRFGGRLISKSDAARPVSPPGLARCHLLLTYVVSGPSERIRMIGHFFKIIFSGEKDK